MERKTRGIEEWEEKVGGRIAYAYKRWNDPH
jgi:hypothetical protein